DEQHVPTGASRWPSRAAIRAYAAEADRAVLDALESRDVESEDNPMTRHGLAAFTILEHEPMHQETLSYIWHRLPYDQKIKPAAVAAPILGHEPPRPRTVRIPAGKATLGADPDIFLFSWDNERPAHRVDVDAFAIDVHSVTNRDFLEFVEGG